jgi:hypothetical protein
MYEVGQEVRCIYGAESRGLEFGKIYTIKAIDEQGDLQLSEVEIFPWLSERFEPIGPKFKKGDTVRTVRKVQCKCGAIDYCGCDIEKGFEDEITAVGYGGNPKLYRVGNFNVIKEQDLELVTPQEEKEEMEIKVGDRVRRGPDWSWFDQDHDKDGTQTIGTVTETERDKKGFGLEVEVRWDGGDVKTYAYRKDRKDVEIINQKEDVMAACEGKSREERAQDNDKEVKRINEQIKCLKEEVKTLNAESKNLRAYETDRDETIAQIKLAKKCKQDEAEAIFALKDKGITV